MLTNPGDFQNVINNLQNWSESANKCFSKCCFLFFCPKESCDTKSGWIEAAGSGWAGGGGTLIMNAQKSMRRHILRKHWP